MFCSSEPGRASTISAPYTTSESGKVCIRNLDLDRARAKAARPIAGRIRPGELEIETKTPCKFLSRKREDKINGEPVVYNI